MRRESIIPHAIGWTVEPPGEHTTTPATASSAPRRGLDGLAKPRACFTAHIDPAGAPAPAVACDTAAMNEPRSSSSMMIARCLMPSAP